MLDPDEKDAKGLPLPARAVFVVGPDKRLKLSILYPATTGRNFPEVGLSPSCARTAAAMLNSAGHLRYSMSAVLWLQPSGVYTDNLLSASLGQKRREAELETENCFPEQILRAIDSLQLTAKHSVATPVNWKHGEDVVVVPTLSDDQAKEKASTFFPLLGLHGQLSHQ